MQLAAVASAQGSSLHRQRTALRCAAVVALAQGAMNAVPAVGKVCVNSRMF
jgi:hypothetical protein